MTSGSHLDYLSAGTRTLAALLIVILPSITNAAFIDFTGTVTGGAVTNGSGGDVPAPFTVGDSLSGFIELEDTAVSPGSTFDTDDLLDFNFVVGPAEFNLTDSMPFGFFGGTVSADGTMLTEFNATTSFGPYPNCEFCNLTLNSGADLFVVTVLGFSASGLVEGTLASEVRSVPEPPTLLMVILGLLVIGTFTQTRSRQPMALDKVRVGRTIPER